MSLLFVNIFPILTISAKRKMNASNRLMKSALLIIMLLKASCVKISSKSTNNDQNRTTLYLY